MQAKCHKDATTAAKILIYILFFFTFSYARIETAPNCSMGGTMNSFTLAIGAARRGGAAGERTKARKKVQLRYANATFSFVITY